MRQKTKDITFISKLNRNKKIIFLIVIIVYLLVCLIPFFILGIGRGALEKAYFFSQIISGIFVIAGVAIALIQYLSNNEELVEDRKRQSIVKAAELADEYCNEIIPYSDRLAVLYSDGQLKKMLEKIEQQELLMFNNEEMRNKFGDKIVFVWLSEMIIKYAKLYNLNISKEEDRKKATKDVTQLLTEFSNRLESMCIKLNTGIADEKTVYQSLHVNFIVNVHMLYFHLSYCNTNESERVYSNVRDMYRMWKDISEERSQKEKEDIAMLQEEQQRKKEAMSEKLIRREKIKKK